MALKAAWAWRRGRMGGEGGIPCLVFGEWGGCERLSGRKRLLCFLLVIFCASHGRAPCLFFCVKRAMEGMVSKPFLAVDFASQTVRAFAYRVWLGTAYGGREFSLCFFLFLALRNEGRRHPGWLEHLSLAEIVRSACRLKKSVPQEDG